MATISKVKIKEGNPLWVFGLLANPANGAVAIPSNFGDITIKVFKVGNKIVDREQIGATIVTNASTTMSSVMTDDLRYTDDEGYNFKYQLPGAYFPNGQTLYQVEIEFTPLVGLAFIETWAVETLNTYFYDTVDADA